MLSPRITTVQFGSELPLLLPPWEVSSAVLLEGQRKSGKKVALSSHCSGTKQCCADERWPPVTLLSRSCCCWGGAH